MIKKKRKEKTAHKEKNLNRFNKIKSISLAIFLIFLFILTNVVYTFFKPQKVETSTVAAIDTNYLAGNGAKSLNDYKLNKMITIEGSEQDGYYFNFPEEEFKEILDKTLFYEDVSYADFGTNNIDALMEFIKAEIFTSLPNISKDPENIRTDGDKLQGAVKFKRKSFNKGIGEYEQEVANDEITNADTSQHTIVIDAGHGSTDGGQVTDNYSDIASSEQELNDGKAKYLEGNTGEDSEGNEYNEWELNQKVVDLVIQKLSQYPSINIIQTGKDQPDYKRMQLAVDSGAEAYISVHFNEKSANRGTEVWISPTEYEDSNGETVQLGDNSESEELGTILLNSISGQMNMGKTSDGVIEYYNQTKSVLKTSEEAGIPNVYVFGNNMATDVLDELMSDNEQGIDDYAQGVVNGILEYFDAKDNVEQNDSVNETEIERYLIYTSPENFDNMINNGDENVLNYFTLDDDMNMIVATWTYSDQEGVTFSRSSANEYITKIQQYVMPYQYPLAFFLDTGNESFARELANLSANSDIIMTVFDNVTVTADKTITTTITEQRTRYWFEESYTEESGKQGTLRIGGQSWGETTSSASEPVPRIESIREESTSSLQLTYADAWCVEYEKYFVTERSDTGFVPVGDIERTEGDWVAGEERIRNTEKIDDETQRDNYEQLYERTITEVENQTRVVRYIFKENPNREPVLDGNVNKFVDLTRKYSGTALSNLESDYGQGLIDILTEREATSNMVELTQWLLQEASKKIYFGLVKYDFSVFDPDNFTNISTGTGSSSMLLDYLKSWENDTIFLYQQGKSSYTSRYS